MNYIILISNPKVIRVDFQTCNTATGWVKNVGQLLAVAGCTGCIARSLRFQHVVGDLQILPWKLPLASITYSEIAFVPGNDPTWTHQSVTSC